MNRFLFLLIFQLLLLTSTALRAVTREDFERLKAECSQEGLSLERLEELRDSLSDLIVKLTGEMDQLTRKGTGAKRAGFTMLYQLKSEAIALLDKLDEKIDVIEQTKLLKQAPDEAELWGLRDRLKSITEAVDLLSKSGPLLQYKGKLLEWRNWVNTIEEINRTLQERSVKETLSELLGLPLREPESEIPFYLDSYVFEPSELEFWPSTSGGKPHRLLEIEKPFESSEPEAVSSTSSLIIPVSYTHLRRRRCSDPR